MSDDPLDCPVARSPATLRPPHGSPSGTSPLLSFGILTDIQLALVEWRYNYQKTEKRHYKTAADAVRSAVNAFRADDTAAVAFILHNGDLIDGLNAENGDGERALNLALTALEGRQSDGPNTQTTLHPSLLTTAEHKAKPGEPLFPVYHTLGNHEFYVFDRRRWIHEFRIASLVQHSHKTTHNITHSLSSMFQDVADDDEGLSTADAHISYYDFSPHPSVRVIVLDSYDISLLGWPSTHPHHLAARHLLNVNNPNSGINDPTGLIGANRRFVAFNGGISHAQLRWLDAVLTDSDALGQRAIIAAHIPVHPETASLGALCYNYQDVLDVVKAHESTALCIAGHDHDGGYAEDNGIHFITLNAILPCPPGRNAYGRVDVYDDVIDLVGVDLMQSYTMNLRPRPQRAHKFMK